MRVDGHRILTKDVLGSSIGNTTAFPIARSTGTCIPQRG
jgi:hypothetical protein